MTKQRKKQQRPELIAYREGDYFSLRIYLPIKWILVIISPVLFKLIPEWWDLIQTILPSLLK